MRASRLITETNHLSSRARTGHIIAQARRLDPARADTLVANLRAGDRYSREVGLLVASAAGRAEELNRYLDDGDVSLRIIAASALVRLGEFAPDAAVAYAGSASAEERRALISAVLRARRRDLADALVPHERAAFRAAAAARLLAVASPDVVRENIDDLLPSLPSAAAVARAYPLQFLDHARRDIGFLPPRAWASWWHRRGSAVLAAVRAGGSANAALELVEEFPPAMGWVRWHSALLGELAGHDRDRLTGALLASPGIRPHLSRRTLRLIAESPSALGIAFARQLLEADRAEFRRLVLSVAPPRRSELFDALVDLLGAAPRLERELLAALPATVRIAQAREMLSQLSQAGEELFNYQARLPFAEAEPLLRPLLTESAPELRAAGYRVLLESVGYTHDRAALRDLLESFTRLPNEQEPVRSAALVAIADLPLRVFDDIQVSALTRIVDDAVTARDHSGVSAAAIRTLASRVLTSTSSTDALRAFAIACIQRSNGVFFLPRLDAISFGLAERVVVALLPLIDEHARVDRHDVLFTLVAALGRRAWGLAALDARLERACANRDAGVASTAISMWIADPRVRTARVRALIAKDRSVLALPQVETVVATAASDLLTRKVLDGAVAGRFQSRNAVWLPPARFSRHWTGEQREAAAARLGRFATARSIDLWVQFRALALLSYVPEFGLRHVLAAASSPVVLTSEKGLALLGGFGADAQVDRVLAGALRTDRARVAGPALVRRAGILRPEEVDDSVRAMLAGEPKVTARKSLAYAVGRAALVEPWALYEHILGDHPHDDVTIAVAAAQRNRLDDPRAVGVLLAQLSGDGRGAGLIGGIDPVTVSALRRHEFAVRLAGICDAPAPATRKRAALAALNWLAFAPDLRAAVWVLLADARDRPTSLPFAGDLARSMLDSGHPEGFRRTVAALLLSDAATPPELDSLARSRISALLHPFGWTNPQRDHPSTAAELEAVIDSLVHAGAFAIEASGAALRLLLQHPDDASADRLSAALGGRAAVALEVMDESDGSQLDRLSRAFPLLVERGSEPELVMVVEFVASVGQLNAKWKSILAALRVSPWAEVRERARRVRTW